MAAYDVVDHLKAYHLERAAQLLPFAPPNHHALRRHINLVATMPEIPEDNNPLDIPAVDAYEEAPSTSTASSTSTAASTSRKGKAPSRAPTTKTPQQETTEAQAPRTTAREQKIAALTEEVNTYFHKREDHLISTVTNLQRLAKDLWDTQLKGLQNINDSLATNVSMELQNAHRPLHNDLHDFYASLQTIARSTTEVESNIRYRLKAHFLYCIAKPLLALGMCSCGCGLLHPFPALATSMQPFRLGIKG